MRVLGLFVFIVICVFSTVIVVAVNTTSSVNFGNGVNFQPAYYCNGDQNLGWDLLNSYSRITSVRIELETGSSSDLNDFTRWISEATKTGKKVIGTYHRYDLLGSNNPNDLLNAANWWKSNYQKLGGNFIINLMNEWGDHSMTYTNYANAYNQAIAVVRQVYSGPIIIDIPGWGQEFYTASHASSFINDKNIIFSAHIYPQAYDSGSNSAPTTKNLDVLNSCGRPCIMGEFGTDGSAKKDRQYADLKEKINLSSADWSGLVDHAKTLGWSVLGWAWNGDGGNMNMVTPSWGSNCYAKSYSPSSYFNTIYNKL